MNKTIKTPATVRELAKIADETGVLPSELLEILERLFGDDWWDREPEEITIISSQA